VLAVTAAAKLSELAFKASASACTGANSSAVAPLTKAAATASEMRWLMPLMSVTAELFTVTAFVTDASRLDRIGLAIVILLY
jgi:hypothetical protein